MQMMMAVSRPSVVIHLCNSIWVLTFVVVVVVVKHRGPTGHRARDERSPHKHPNMKKISSHF